MDRRDFIQSIAPVAAAAALNQWHSKDDAAKQPAFLRTGDTIGIVATGGSISREAVEPAVQQLKAWGFAVKIGSTIGKQYNTFGGTDEERARDLQRMLDDREVKAILCARGGYGTVRIIDSLDFKQFRKHPKWIAGFSDVTVLHSHISRNFNIATIHCKMCNSFPGDPSASDPVQRATIDSIRAALVGEPMVYSASINPSNRYGKASGRLVGGNLKILETLAATKSDLNCDGAILFIEDTNEYLYNIDRMLVNLERTGKLRNLAGLLVGGFKIKPDDPGEEFNQALEQIVLSKVSSFNYPVGFNFPVGHQRENYAVRCGLVHTMEVGVNGTRVEA